MLNLMVDGNNAVVFSKYSDMGSISCCASVVSMQTLFKENDVKPTSTETELRSVTVYSNESH